LRRENIYPVPGSHYTVYNNKITQQKQFAYVMIQEEETIFKETEPTKHRQINCVNT